jgi:hypothetical protein
MAEQIRLNEARDEKAPWKSWAVSERKAVWYGARGLQQGRNAWEYFSHDQARSRA